MGKRLRAISGVYDMDEFAGQVALVTGASSGIGKATALMLGARGAHVVVSARRESECDETASRIREAGGKATTIVCDIADAHSVAALFDRISHDLGRLDLAFNNAGISSPMQPLAVLEQSEVDRSLAINIEGTVACMRREIAMMLDNGGGAIVNNSSMAGITGYAGLSIYSAGKHAVVGLTRSAAREYARKNIRVNCVCPGPVLTEMVASTIASVPKDAPRPSFPRLPMGRMGQTDEVAEPVCFLLSDKASFITGVALAIDGGESCGLGDAVRD